MKRNDDIRNIIFNIKKVKMKNAKLMFLLSIILLFSCNSDSNNDNKANIEEEFINIYGKEKYSIVKIATNGFKLFLKNNAFYDDGEECIDGIINYLKKYSDKKIDLCGYHINKSEFNTIRQEIENGKIFKDWFILKKAPRTLINPANNDTIIRQGDNFYQFNLFGDYYNSLKDLQADSTSVLYKVYSLT